MMLLDVCLNMNITARTPDLRFFSGGENADGNIRTGTWRNIPILVWKKNVEEMRRKCRWEYSDRNVEKSLHHIRISAISAFPILRIPAIMQRMLRIILHGE